MFVLGEKVKVKLGIGDLGPEVHRVGQKGSGGNRQLGDGEGLILRVACTWVFFGGLPVLEMPTL